MITELLRKIVRSHRVQKVALASGALEELARPYITGKTPEAARDVARDMVKKGLLVGFSYLPASDSEAESLAELRRLLEVLGDEAKDMELSVKPSQLGLRESEEAAEKSLRGLVERAGDLGALVTLEMQGVKHYAETLRLWEKVRADHPHLGVTLPVEIRRAERDCARMVEEGSPRIRLCIGSYPVPKSLGIQDEHEKTKALVRCLRLAMEGGARVMLATHHPTVIAIGQELARRHPQGELEFQMFHGVRPLEQRRLSDIGHRSRVLLPYGPAGFEYLMTRVAARPQTAVSYLRAITDKR